MKDLTLDVDQAGELKAAFRREGPWTKENIKALCEWKGFLTEVLAVLEGKAKIVLLPLLQFVATITIAARMRQFVPRESYVVNTLPGPHVKIRCIDLNFTAWFGDKVEEPTAETTLRSYVFTRLSEFAPAMKEIADSGVATKTTPGELFSMLESQPDGPKSAAGPLLTNDYANLFEIDDVNGVPRLVYAIWYAAFGGWCVFARGTSNSNQWDDGGRVFSRDSRLPVAA